MSLYNTPDLVICSYSKGTLAFCTVAPFSRALSSPQQLSPIGFAVDSSDDCRHNDDEADSDVDALEQSVWGVVPGLGSQRQQCAIPNIPHFCSLWHIGADYLLCYFHVVLQCWQPFTAPARRWHALFGASPHHTFVLFVPSRLSLHYSCMTWPKMSYFITKLNTAIETLA